MKKTYQSPAIAIFATERLMDELPIGGEEKGVSGEYLSNSAAIVEEESDDDPVWIGDFVQDKTLSSALERESQIEE